PKSPLPGPRLARCRPRRAGGRAPPPGEGPRRGLRRQSRERGSCREGRRHCSHGAASRPPFWGGLALCAAGIGLMVVAVLAFVRPELGFPANVGVFAVAAWRLE